MKHVFVPLLVLCSTTIINIYDLLLFIYDNGFNEFLVWQSSYSSPNISLVFGLVAGSFMPGDIIPKKRLFIIKDLVDFITAVLIIEAVFSILVWVLMGVDVKVLIVMLYRLCQLYPAISLSFGVVLGWCCYNTVDN